jgi:hypothetical protein
MCSFTTICFWMVLQISAQEAPPLLLEEASIAGVPKVRQGAH